MIQLASAMRHVELGIFRETSEHLIVNREGLLYLRIDLGERRALPEGTVADGRQRGGQRHRGQAGAILESARGDGGHGQGRWNHKVSVLHRLGQRQRARGSHVDGRSIARAHLNGPGIQPRHLIGHAVALLRLGREDGLGIDAARELRHGPAAALVGRGLAERDAGLTRDMLTCEGVAVDVGYGEALDGDRGETVEHLEGLTLDCLHRRRQDDGLYFHYILTGARGNVTDVEGLVARGHRLGDDQRRG